MSDTYPHAGGLADRLCKFFLRDPAVAHVDDSWIAEVNHLALREVGPLLAGAVTHNWLIKAPIEGQRLRFRYSPGPALAALRAGKIAPSPPAPAPEAKDAPAPKTEAPAPASAAAAPAVATPPAPAQRQGRHKPYGLLPPLDVNSLTVQTGPLPQPARVPGGRYADLFKKLSAPDTFTLAPSPTCTASSRPPACTAAVHPAPSSP